MRQSWMVLALRFVVLVFVICCGWRGIVVAGASAPPVRLEVPLYPRLEGYRFEEAFPGLDPFWAIGAQVPPGETNSMVFLRKVGIVLIVTNLAAPTATVFVDLASKTLNESECGLLGLAFHPGWRTNRQVFIYYSTVTTWAGTNGLHQRLARFLLDPENPNRLLPESEVPLITQADPDLAHQAGDLEFGPDGYLYVSVGDGGGAWDNFQNSQRIDGGFFSGILRLDVDGREGSLPPNPHPAVSPGTYWIPPDNPFIGRTNFVLQPVLPETVRTEFWAVGLRNPFRMAFHPVTGELFANDTGQNRREEINRILPGRNYGWVFYEGTLAWPWGIPAGNEFVFPLHEYEHEQGRVAITGGAWCLGDRYPALGGAYVFADLGGSIGALSPNADGTYAARWVARTTGVIDVTINPRSGELLFMNATDGMVWKLAVESSDDEPLPERLSQTGVFTNLANLGIASGFKPYEINHPFWSDHAQKQRWFGLIDPGHPARFSPTETWRSAEGSVWVKHFELATAADPAAPLRRLETRLLVRNSHGVWGASYRWRPDGSDADLVPTEGLDEVIPVALNTNTSALRQQRWRYPGRDECLACHTRAAGFSLGFNTAQLNLTNGGTWQIGRLSELGYVTGVPAAPVPLPKLAALDDSSASVGFRARSYLAANCAYCHFPGGPTRAQWDARLTAPLDMAGIVGVNALNNLGDVYGQTVTQIVFPGELQQSSIFRRVAELEPYHMPPLGSSQIHTNAVNLLREWILGELPRQTSFLSWQTNHFGGPAREVAAATADPDGDGLNNELEWLLGEDPQAAQRYWQLSGVEEDGQLVLRFERRAGLLMLLESMDTEVAREGWQPVEAMGNEYSVPSGDGLAEIRVPIPVTGTSLFRVRVTRL